MSIKTIILEVEIEMDPVACDLGVLKEDLRSTVMSQPGVTEVFVEEYT